MYTESSWTAAYILSSTKSLVYIVPDTALSAATRWVTILQTQRHVSSLGVASGDGESTGALERASRIDSSLPLSYVAVKMELVISFRCSSRGLYTASNVNELSIIIMVCHEGVVGQTMQVILALYHSPYYSIVAYLFSTSARNWEPHCTNRHFSGLCSCSRA